MFTGELDPKRLGLLQEMVPANKVVGLLINPNNPSSEKQLRETQGAAGALRLQLHVGRVGGDAEIDAAFESLVHAGAQMLLVIVSSCLGRVVGGRLCNRVR
jgi:ABC-type uncharacterized transport system substrate-binding protein